jgi:nucleotide-binding universal stress UspA family protein
MIRPSRILCPTDLSPASDGALRYATALARTYEAKLIICHAAEASPLADGSGREQIRRLFEERVTDHCGCAAGLPDCEVVIAEDDPATAITRTAAERRVDLIVMRSRRRPLAAALLGSTAEAVCRTAPCPVLVTHEREREWAGLETGAVALGRVLVAYDFSNDAELALAYGLSLAQEYQAELHLLHVLQPSPLPAPVPAFGYLPAGDEGAFQQAARRLQFAVPSEAHLWSQVRHAVREGQPYREILSYAEEQEVDLICMGVHGAGFAMRALFGSNADRVLRQSPCPVLIARPLKPMFLAAVEGGAAVSAAR